MNEQVETNDARYTLGAPPYSACACGCSGPPTWTHNFPNGSTAYLCDAGKAESARHYVEPRQA